MNKEQILYDELVNLQNAIVNAQVQSGQVATGKTKSSFSVEATQFKGTLFGASYLGVLKTGRKPGKVPRDFIDILKRWATAKGLSFSDEKQFNRWANAVKWKIIREGTKLYRSGQTIDIFDTPIENFSRSLAERTAIYYQEKIANEIFNF